MDRARILRIVTRLNTGGPARHLASLTRALDPGRYRQWLIAGREGPGEGSMRPLLEAQGIEVIHVPEMVGTPRLEPADLLALTRIRRLIRDLRPDIIETHLSKAGVVGRLAARLEGSAATLHIYHGHVLAGYFGVLKTWMARAAESALARITDRLVAVSASVRDDLVRYGVASRDRISVVELGLDMQPLLGCQQHRGSLRRELGLDVAAPLVGFVGRLSPLKNPGLFLDAAAKVLAVRPDVHFLVVGDGEIGPAMRALAGRLGLMQRLTFTGWRYDLVRVYADLDVLVSSSNSEGTPFAIIEAMAAGCPVVATRVGGVSDIVDDHVTGLLVPPVQPDPLVTSILRLLGDSSLARSLAQAAQARAQVRFSAARLASEMDVLYTRILEARGVRWSRGALTVRATSSHATRQAVD